MTNFEEEIRNRGEGEWALYKAIAVSYSTYIVRCSYIADADCFLKLHERINTVWIFACIKDEKLRFVKFL